jgi:hypothetical protein
MLPKLDVPIYEVKLISTGKTIRFRPFLVKEQKLLLMAQQSEDNKETVTVVKQILKNCIVDEIDVDNLATFDVEYIFLNLRARSVNDIVDLQYKCNNIIAEEKPCGSIEKFKVNLLEIKPTLSEGHDKKIQLNDKIGVVMKYPTFEMISKLDGKNEDEIFMALLVDCIDYIYDEDRIYKPKEYTAEELAEFIDNMQQKELSKIQEFFDSSPKLIHKLDFKCKKCQYEETINLEGLQNFFI